MFKHQIINPQFNYAYFCKKLDAKKSESGPLEWLAVGLMKVMDPILIGKLKKYQSIAARTIASAMYKQSLKNETGVHIYSFDKIKELS